MYVISHKTFPFDWSKVALVRLQPVSYTHLDVYKRQGYSAPSVYEQVKLFSAFLNKQQKMFAGIKHSISKRFTSTTLFCILRDPFVDSLLSFPFTSFLIIPIIFFCQFTSPIHCNIYFYICCYCYCCFFFLVCSVLLSFFFLFIRL